MTADVFGSDHVLRMRVGDVTQEVRVLGHLRKVGTGLRVTEKRLGEEANERLAEVTVDLATEDVELETQVSIITLII